MQTNVIDFYEEYIFLYCHAFSDIFTQDWFQKHCKLKSIFPLFGTRDRLTFDLAIAPYTTTLSPLFSIIYYTSCNTHDYILHELDDHVFGDLVER